MIFGSNGITRRSATKLLAGSLASALLPTSALAAPIVRPDRKPVIPLSPDEDAFLDEMERQACLYFYEQADSNTGQVLDRAFNKATTGERDRRITSSIAATGFGLTAFCIAHKRGYLPADRVLQRVRTTIQFHVRPMPHEHGFFYHFNDVKTGLPLLNTEVSPIDTAILLCGILTCRAYFNDDAITTAANIIYNRIDWNWMLNDGPTFALGWLPATGFIGARWDHYAEMMMLYLLAIGATKNPIDPSYWKNFSRPEMRWGPYRYISGRDPLFIHLYSHAWFDFNHKRDAYADYYANTITAVRAHRAFLFSLNRGYNDDYWGVTASDWMHGYAAWGGPPLLGPVDGSVVPCAPAGSLPFLPRECLRCLQSLKKNFGKDAWGRYGPCDAFHPQLFWYDPDVLGIDLGIGILAAENLRTGFVWDTFMSNPEAVNAMKLVGFRNH
jgi:hypothetical protein